MDRAIPLGRLAGVRIGMSWVVPFVACLYALSLATNLLPRSVEGQSTTSYWLAGGLGAALLFLSLLAHEMGHALVALSVDDAIPAGALEEIRAAIDAVEVRAVNLAE